MISEGCDFTIRPRFTILNRKIAGRWRPIKRILDQSSRAITARSSNQLVRFVDGNYHVTVLLSAHLESRVRSRLIVWHAGFSHLLAFGAVGSVLTLELRISGDAAVIRPNPDQVRCRRWRRRHAHRRVHESCKFCAGFRHGRLATKNAVAAPVKYDLISQRIRCGDFCNNKSRGQAAISRRRRLNDRVALVLNPPPRVSRDPTGGARPLGVTIGSSAAVNGGRGRAWLRGHDCRRSKVRTRAGAACYS